MDIIQGLIETGNAGKSGWRIVNNGGAIGVLNNRTSNVYFSILNDGGIGTSSNVPVSLINSYSGINVSNYSGTGNVVSTGGTGGTGGSSQWTTVGTKIYYNLGNIGIGTIDPIAPLHIYNNAITAVLPTEIVVAGATSATISGTTDRVISFPYSGTGTTKDYTFTTTEALNCDILIVGGGGAGGSWMGGGGGAGGVVYTINQPLSIGTYTIKVGRGGIGVTSSGTGSGMYGANADGIESSIMNNNGSTYISMPFGETSLELRGYGGGQGGTYADSLNGKNGGSGGGCAERDPAFAVNVAGISIQGNTYWNGSSYVAGGKSGRTNIAAGLDYDAGGGGGLGAQSATYNRNGNEGVSISITGTSQFYAAGGGGGQYCDNPAWSPTTLAGLGGSGIGGNGRIWNRTVYSAAPRDVATSGTNGTGSGGGGGAWYQTPTSFSGDGGSGIVIIRYRRQTQPSVSNARLLLDATTTGTATVEFRRGTGADAQNDYRFINDSNGSLKLQCENSTQVFGNTVADLAWFSSNETIIHKNTTMNGRVGIGTVYHASRSLDVVGDANVSGVLSVAGSLSVTSNAIITNSITSNTSFTIHNGLSPPIPNVFAVVPLPNEIVVAGTTTGIIGADRFISFPYSGSATTKDYTFTTTEALECDILVVGGGGGGGRFGGGGGGGAILFGTNITLNAGSSVSIKVGNGGAGSTSLDTGTNGINGIDSSITLSSTEYFAKGGGGGGSRAGASQYVGVNGNSGGSGGGGSHANAAPQGLGGASNKITYPNFQSFGNSGGKGKLGQQSGVQPEAASGGGGGAGSAGSDFSNATGGGNGGTGKEFISYFGASVGHSGWFGGGGGGNTYTTAGNGGYGNGGNGLFGGGGQGGHDNNNSAVAGLANTGGGGGGGRNNAPTANGGAGGSGIVIIRYRKAPADIINETISGLVGTTDRYTIFPYSGTGATKDYSITTTESLSCDILMIGGGGGGGVGDAGGGGAGACIVAINQSLNAGNYTIRVGNGGLGGILSSTGTITRLSTDGVNSSIFNSSGIEIYRAVGGGEAGNVEGDYASITQFIGKTGGCGGGAGFWQGNTGVSGGAVSTLNIVNSVQNISPRVSTTYGVYGNVGGNSVHWNNSYPNANCGGGGGIGVAGSAGIIGRSGVGGNGLAQVTINSTQYNFKTYFAPDWSSFGVLSGGLLYIGGGGGGAGFASAANQAKISGGLGGGGIGDYAGNKTVFADAPTNGMANTGSGGGGACGNAGSYGGAGGSGLIIVRYRKLPKEIVVAGTTSTIVGTADRCISFPYTSDSSGLTGQTQYTFTTTEALSCDILVVGGGGGGGRRGGAGGGAGAFIYHKNVIIDGTYNIKVGDGGNGVQGTGDNTGASGSRGYNSSLSYVVSNIQTTLYLSNGGGGGQGGSADTNNSGGSSGGGTWSGGIDSLATDNIFNSSVITVSNNQYVNTLISPEGCRGNIGGNQLSNYRGGGGGGAGSPGMNHDVETTVNDGYGGLGLAVDITGTSVVYAGGGNGCDYSAGRGEASGVQIQSFNPLYPTIESRGGGGFGSDSQSAQNGLNGTGGGGGGQGADLGVFSSGKGGSGIVIIRYRKLPTSLTSSSINFIRGTTTDTNHDYKVGNFNGEFKVISSVFSASNIDTDYIRITTAGAITNPSGTANWNIGSDRRIKENIERASYDKCFENINRLELNRFNYVSGFNTVNRDKTQLGFIAQEVYDIFPKSISTQGYYSDTLNIPDLLSIDVSQINYSLYGAVKKLIEINNDKDNRLKALDDELKTIETILNITPDTVASNVVLEPVIISMTSNVVLEEITSNVSNVVLEEMTSNITVDS